MKFAVALVAASLASHAVAQRIYATPTTEASSSEATTSSTSGSDSPPGYTGCHSHGDGELYCINSEGSEELCHQHADGDWHCEADAVPTGEDAVVASNGCVQHGTHWHCPEGVSEPCDAQLGEYDLGLHIAAVFVLLVASGIGVWLPVLFGTRRATRSRFSAVVVYIRDNILRHFGTGVIISTAYIHLIMHAFVMFSSECLGELAYEATAPAIMMASTMLLFAIDYAAARALTARSLKDAAANAPNSPPSPGSTTVGIDEEKGKNFGHSHDFSQVSVEVMAKDPKSMRAHWEVQLLEAGIIFHSIMIGVALGAQSGSTFITTWLAITFHQLFEGMGLGARIGRLEWERRTFLKKGLMCLAYQLTTPVGMAIGMGVRTTFSLGSTATLLSIGILDSISAGILLYASIAQLLVGDWLAGDLRTAPIKTVAVSAFSLFCGLLAMSVIGKWA